jgi:hypothetical protein
MKNTVLKNSKKLFLLNAPVLTAYGDFRFEPISLEAARDLVKEFTQSGKPLESAIGHTATAEILSEVLGIEIKTARIEVRQQPSDAALVFRLRSRVGEAKVLDREEMESIGYELGLLTRKD